MARRIHLPSHHSTAALSLLPCSKCDSVTLHRYNSCIGCQTMHTFSPPKIYRKRGRLEFALDAAQ